MLCTPLLPWVRTQFAYPPAFPGCVWGACLQVFVLEIASISDLSEPVFQWCAPLHPTEAACLCRCTHKSVWNCRALFCFSYVSPVSWDLFMSFFPAIEIFFSLNRRFGQSIHSPTSLFNFLKGRFALCSSGWCSSGWCRTPHVYEALSSLEIVACLYHLNIRHEHDWFFFSFLASTALQLFQKIASVLVWVHIRVSQCICMVSCESVLFYLSFLGTQTQVVRLESTHSFLLSYLDGPDLCFWRQGFI